MNIFVSNPSPEVSAYVLDDKRINKMVVESAQMMSTTLIFYNKPAPYKSCYLNHPCNQWVRSSRENYTWLFYHFIALCGQYRERSCKTHACEQYTEMFRNYALEYVPADYPYEFYNGSAIFNSQFSIFEKYKMCLRNKWENDKRTPRWYGETKSRLEIDWMFNATNKATILPDNDVKEVPVQAFPEVSTLILDSVVGNLPMDYLQEPFQLQHPFRNESGIWDESGVWVGDDMPQ